MPKLKDLFEKRNNIAGQMRALNEGIAADQKWTEEQRTQFKKMKSELVDLDTSIELAESVRSQNEEDAKREQEKEERSRNMHDATGGDEKRYQETFDVLLRQGFGALNAEQRSIIHKRAQSIGTDAKGGFTVPTEFQSEIIRSMKDYGGIEANCLVVNTSAGNNMLFPVTDGTSNIGTFIGENAQANTSDMAFTQVSIGAKKLTSGVILVSNELLQDTGISLDSLIAQEIAERIGRKKADAIVNGTGTGLENKGLAKQVTGSVNVAAVGKFTYKDANALIHSIDPAYRKSTSFKLGFNDSTLKLFRDMEDGNGRPLWMPAVAGMTPAQIMDYAYFIDQAIADAGATNDFMYAGDWSRFMVRNVAGMNLVRMGEKFADSDQTGFVAFHRFDTLLKDTAAIKSLKYKTA